MGLVKKESVISFDLSRIEPGWLLWGRHRTWGCGKAGIVTAAARDRLVVQFHPGIGNVTNHFVIPVSEAASGEWEIRWSSDMEEVHEYRGESEENEAGRADI